MEKSLKIVYFSPTDTTKNIVNKVASEMALPIIKEFNLTNYEYNNFKYTFNENDVILLGSPVYGARIPKTAKNRFNGLTGSNSKIVLVLTYGNVHYDYSPIEFYEMIKNKGFTIIGIGVFSVRHNVFKNIGLNRPNEQDYKEIKQFSQNLVEKINRNTNKNIEIKWEGSFGENPKYPVRPKGNKNCQKCGLCIKLCPENAIEPTDPRKTIKDKCAFCTRCIKYCPNRARNFPKTSYFIAELFVRIMKRIKYNQINGNEIIL